MIGYKEVVRLALSDKARFDDLQDNLVCLANEIWSLTNGRGKIERLCEDQGLEDSTACRFDVYRYGEWDGWAEIPYLLLDTRAAEDMEKNWASSVMAWATEEMAKVARAWEERLAEARARATALLEKRDLQEYERLRAKYGSPPTDKTETGTPW